ncbi:serine hydrolase [Pontixanthobacter aestiaquae]|uniref:Serine hydrolase n=1 Tax=Pontixanthobacter aestiaquae TaxID=1509367 RepID=A0A844Z9S2_9SPHN|nr:serine hydrolase [Pontixanthobacter aestiaquae]MDN3645054.1 serine hydrolase [Pontixanthobacter aestiaquae]MXO83946.1 serine hydrolase [Pontixanthobacter aestiaquae]
MKKLAFAAAFLFSPVAVFAQSAQELHDARYDRALAAGYKALFLCSAIGNAERNAAARTPESVHQWELTGIQAPLNDIIQDMPYEIVRRPSGQIGHVAVEWADDMPARTAVYFAASGCSILPIGAPQDWGASDNPLPVPAGENATAESSASADSSLSPVFDDALAEKYGAGTRTTAVLVRKVENGKITSQSDRYADGFDGKTPQRTWSVAKSIAATFVGMAVQSREFSVDDPVNMNYWLQGGTSDPRNAITIDHMLRMASGRYTDTPGNRTDPLYWGGSSVNEQAVQWPIIHKPGTKFRYSNNDTLMAIKAIGDYVLYYPAPELLERIDMNNTVVESDIRGDYVLSSQVWATAPDLANLGQLYLNKGMWNGTRVLPENWTDYVSSPSGPQPEGRPFGYGAGFWLLNNSDGVPPDTFAALGNRGQHVVIVPSRNIVIVRRGEDPAGNRFDIAAFTKDVLAALEN